MLETAIFLTVMVSIALIWSRLWRLLIRAFWLLRYGQGKPRDPNRSAFYDSIYRP